MVILGIDTTSGTTGLAIKKEKYLRLEKEIKEYLEKFKKGKKVITRGKGNIFIINKNQ